jgi:hypothetical protein
LICDLLLLLVQLHAAQRPGDRDAAADGEGSLYSSSQRMLLGHVASSKFQADVGMRLLAMMDSGAMWLEEREYITSLVKLGVQVMQQIGKH